MPGLCFWGLSGLLLLVDTTEKPTFISRYRIQRGKNEPVSDTASLSARKAGTNISASQRLIIKVIGGDLNPEGKRRELGVYEIG